MAKINLSNWSINLLKTDMRKWYKCYVMGQWDDEFETYLSVGACFARCMDDWSKKGDYNIEKNISLMEEEFKKAERVEEFAENKEVVETLIKNIGVIELSTPIESEKEVILPLNDKYDLKCKFDALYKDCILDHKTVSAFTKEEDKEEKYGQQIRIYQYARYLLTGEKMKGIIQEIKKGKPSIPTTFKKEDMEGLIPREKKEGLKTVTEMKEYLREHPIADRCGNRLVFEWDDNLIDEIDTLLRRAIKRADYLATVTDLNDIL